MERATGYLEVSASPLVRVIGIGQQAEDAGIRVELIALEIRQLGAILYWKAYTFEEGLASPAPDSGVRRFQVSISAFEGFGHDLPGALSTPRVDGRWSFELDLDG